MKPSATSFSPQWSLVLGVALCLDTASRVALVRLGVRLQPPLWGVLVAAGVFALFYLAFLFWVVLRTAGFVQRAAHRGRAAVLTAGSGGLLGALGTHLLEPWDPSRTAAPLFPGIRFVVSTVFAIGLVWYLARRHDTSEVSNRGDR